MAPGVVCSKLMATNFGSHDKPLQIDVANQHYHHTVWGAGIKISGRVMA